MTIEEAIKEIESITVVTDEKQALAFALAVHTMKKYQMIQADYETRLKADLEAILTDLQLEIEEMDSRKGDCYFATPGCVSRDTVVGLIQEKINELKENK